VSFDQGGEDIDGSIVFYILFFHMDFFLAKLR